MKPAVVCEFDYQYPELKIKLKKEHIPCSTRYLSKLRSSNE